MSLKQKNLAPYPPCISIRKIFALSVALVLIVGYLTFQYHDRIPILGDCLTKNGSSENLIGNISQAAETLKNLEERLTEILKANEELIE